MDSSNPCSCSFMLQNKSTVSGYTVNLNNNYVIDAKVEVPVFVKAFGSKMFQTTFTVEEMKKLQLKAEKFVEFHNQTKGMQSISHFYRNKSPEYYCNILQNYQGIMKTYLKDFNGDPACPINGRISGLFFSGIKDKHSNNLATVSPFGTHRLILPINRVLRENCNLYFTDFYCFGMEVHYVTVVVTKPGSKIDQFCFGKLPKLDLFDNPFLYISYKGTESVTQTVNDDSIEFGKETKNEKAAKICDAVHVEIYYTENVDITYELEKEGAEFHCTDTIGRGFSLPEGIPKNSLCPKCNI